MKKPNWIDCQKKCIQMNRVFYRTYSSFLKSKFKEQVHKIPININTNCPNRDGTKSTDGCIYCSPNGSGTGIKGSVKEQIELYLGRNPNGKYIAYFQSYSNMYGNEDKLFKYFSDALDYPEIVGLSIATRPDTVNSNLIKRLLSLNTYIQIELGLESANENTLKRINRHDIPETFINACAEIKAINKNIHIVGHMIVGLPGDKYADFLNTALMISKYAHGIKFHHLYIEKDMPIRDLFENNELQVLSENEYMDILLRLFSNIDPNTVIHRLKSSSNPKKLIAPLWTLDKCFSEKLIEKALIREVTQGKTVLPKNGDGVWNFGIY